MTVFSNETFDATEQTCFFGKQVNIARYDKQRYSIFEKLTDKQLGFFWRPEEVDLSRDGKDFKGLTDHEKHIFTSNLKRQILLDSVQGRAPSLAFLPICSLPELETWIQTWTFSETIHSRSYTHIITANSQYALFKHDKKHAYEHKKDLWLCLNAVNALEGVRFYVSFACSWAFAEVKKMEGNAKIIKLIARDENVHLASTQQLLKILPKEDPDFARIQEETRAECIDMFHRVVEQEKSWAHYLFQNGSMIGLNEELLCNYVDHIAAKRMGAIGLNGKPGANPLPWTQKWISGSDVQVAPQETEITSYVIGGVKKDVDENTFKGFTL